MAVKLFLDNIPLLKIHSFKGFLNRHKKIKMMKRQTIIQIAVTSSNFKQVDSYILIPKNQALQIVHLKHHAYYYLTLTQQLTHLISGQPS